MWFQWVILIQRQNYTNWSYQLGRVGHNCIKGRSLSEGCYATKPPTASTSLSKKSNSGAKVASKLLTCLQGPIISNKKSFHFNIIILSPGRSEGPLSNSHLFFVDS